MIKGKPIKVSKATARKSKYKYDPMAYTIATKLILGNKVVPMDEWPKEERDIMQAKANSQIKGAKKVSIKKGATII